ncbi:hypothetical protein B0H13DRAFT_2319332 [Mycena leptocephala]|nr:hypothetical protein B0H13DRAFT_2319332 [Mycena leptocephala]
MPPGSTITVEDVEKVAAHDANTVHTSSTATIHVNDPDTAKQVIVDGHGLCQFTFIRSVLSFNYHDPATELLFVFASPVASSISSPSLSVISAHLKTQPGVILEKMTLSIFVLAYAIGPLFWGLLSELCGRLFVLQVSNIRFLGMSLVFGCFSKH